MQASESNRMKLIEIFRDNVVFSEFCIIFGPYF